jgi:4-hydroxy-tetrahydrodipicolinate synthase
VRLEGSIVPIVTPFKNGKIDDSALQRLIERQIAAGSHGVSVGGTTGEPAALSLEEREQVIELAVKFTGGRVPVLAGSGSVNLDETLRLTKFAQEVGASAGLLIAPYYVKPNQEGLYCFFGTVAEAMPGFPLVLYNIPGRAAVSIEVRTLARLAKDYGNIVGVKHSVKDLDIVSWTLKECGPDFKVFCGYESLTVPMLLLGGHGMIAATGNILPKEVAKQYDLVKAGKIGEAVELHYHLLEINDAIFWDTNPIPLKTVLSMMGLIEKAWRPPLGPGSAELEVRLKEMAGRYGLLQRVTA